MPRRVYSASPSLVDATISRLEERGRPLTSYRLIRVVDAPDDIDVEGAIAITETRIKADRRSISFQQRPHEEPDYHARKAELAFSNAFLELLFPPERFRRWSTKGKTALTARRRLCFAANALFLAKLEVDYDHWVERTFEDLIDVLHETDI